MMALLLKIWKFLQLPKSWQLWFMRRFEDQFLVGVTGIIFNDKDEILCFKNTYRSVSWSLPGGYIRSKEHPKEALEREIMEESGMTVSADERQKIRTDRESARLDIVYVGTYIGGDFRPSAEIAEAQFFAFDALPHMRKNDLLLIERAMKHRKIGNRDL
jgi:ADP-ribose pyrophosphatase YjhB (NUDIX family)